jgi:Tol biopolymer transport system component
VVGSVPGVTFSPDGSLAAYESGGRVYVMNADGTHRRVLYSGVDSKNGDCGLAWAPDSKRIAFSPVQYGRLYKINVATGKATRLGRTSTGACGATWGYISSGVFLNAGTRAPRNAILKGRSTGSGLLFPVRSRRSRSVIP